MKPDVNGLIAAAGAGKGASPAPVHLWNPPYCGEMDLRIARDGTWFHEGTPIGRAPLVRLFANILKREGDRYYLVSPVEKIGIQVEDAPFIAVDFRASGSGPGQTLTFTTNIGDEVTAGPDHAIRVTEAPDGEPAPYLHVRGGLEARIDRKSFYRLVDLGEQNGPDFGVTSNGTFFRLGGAEDRT